ncbi:MAG TPA: HNH endonuclease [Candidatus Pacearchaeota archaeon]|nr:HNH endonuclease [Candidatus Pacearchaeota archaeon]
MDNYNNYKYNLEKYKRENTDPNNKKRLYPIYMKNRGKYPFQFSEYEIHHKDFNNGNNNINNLILLTPTEHDTIHLKKMQKIQEQKKEIEAIAKLREGSEREEKKRKKEIMELEKEKRRFESHKKETQRRRLRQYEDQKRIILEKERNRTHYKNEEEKRGVEKIKEEENKKNTKRKKIIKNLTEGVIILFFITIIVILYILISQNLKDSKIPLIEPEGTPVNLTYQQIFYLCEEGCEDNGGFMNSYYNTQKEIGCTCINKYENGESIVKIFDKVKMRWAN